jgi:hypothetical protein
MFIDNEQTKIMNKKKKFFDILENSGIWGVGTPPALGAGELAGSSPAYPTMTIYFLTTRI